MSKALDAKKDHGGRPDLSRRQLGAGLLAVLGGGLGVVSTAEAFAPNARGHFTAASRILGGYGVTVVGDTSRSYDAINFTVVPLAGTEYNQTVVMRNRLGEVIPCLKTSVFEDDVIATHFHPTGDGEIVPCVRTTIEGHSLATYELFDAAEADIDPCMKVESQMLEGGVLGAVEVTVEPDVNLIVRVGDRTYYLLDGELVLSRAPVS